MKFRILVYCASLLLTVAVGAEDAPIKLKKFPNPNVQIPMSNETPKPQIPMSKSFCHKIILPVPHSNEVRDRENAERLERYVNFSVEIWGFIGHWDLDIGI